MENSLYHYLKELRSRLGKAFLGWVLIFSPLFYFATDIYHWLAGPLLRYLPEGGHLVSTQVTAPFTTPLQLSFVLSLWLGMPWFLYQLWSFISPALYPKERGFMRPLLIASIMLFYLGLGFAFELVCPIALQFFMHLAPQGVMIMTDIQHYLDFVLGVTFAFGLAFQVPVITWALLEAQILTINQLVASRPYIIILAFVVGMILTPPDVISQILLAIPLWGLFELGLWLFSYKEKRKGLHSKPST